MTLVSSSAQTDEFELLLPDSNEINKTKHNPSKYQSKLGTSLYSLKIIKSQKEAWMSRQTKKCLFLLLSLIGFCFIGLIFFSYYCTGSKSLCEFPSYKTNGFLSQTNSDNIGKPLSTGIYNIPTFDDVVSKDFQFDIEDHDVMVFLHIQKTGGTTFGKHLVKHLELDRECVCHRKYKKRCTCLRPGPNSEETWLFSRYSTGWKCGVHADWTELTSCVDTVMDKIDAASVKRRYFYITFLREPVHRYLSEFRHVQRGATWKSSLHYCKGRTATKKEIPPCYEGVDWSDVTLEEFLLCDSNLAHNRQTRMLSDLTLINCYNHSSMKPEERDATMLASAKANLERMAFFGLTEFQENSQYIFEETFNLKFNIRFEQYNSSYSDEYLHEITPELMEKVRQRNTLDIQLYNFAKELLLKRYKHLKALDTHFKEHFRNMGHAEFSWENIEGEN
ncbi:Heparan-sulfate 6-O-sulfotransferase 3 [Armadillidium nasatum]|uniref:Heparan-sulfate 6-O-sulfotransferase n=1 Tax=Armadillidium nasatum TaxID=96803 RepID=A0A5N5SKM9_9CRUS|nr:Heparan-sulfate 6-O-sulfotransferase 3 [Armadillidium nasatum]